MILRLFNDSVDIAFSEDRPAMVYIDNYSLYATLVLSIENGEGLLGRYPYAFIEKDQIITGKHICTVISDVLHFPKLSTASKNALYLEIQKAVSSTLLRTEIEQSACGISNAIQDVVGRKMGDYSFGYEWDLGIFLKSFKLEPYVSDVYSVYEIQSSWLKFLSDINCRKPVIYANIQKNIDQKSTDKLIACAKKLQIPLLFIESGKCLEYFDNVNSYIIDRDFYSYSIPV